MIGELVPLIILSFISILLNKEMIIAETFGKIFLKFSTISILGFLTAKIILFFQWYWIIAPEYRKISGDMSEGFAWTIFFSIIGSIIIMMSYLMILGSFKLFKN
ncbi:MAG TPA: hypothetical protein PKE38_16305 [Ignavibacteriaceae bacterium]|nr:hypothetical protein [Ignavibacteriaceae bacterium]